MKDDLVTSSVWRIALSALSSSALPVSVVRQGAAVPEQSVRDGGVADAFSFSAGGSALSATK